MNHNKDREDLFFTSINNTDTKDNILPLIRTTGNNYKHDTKRCKRPKINNIENCLILGEQDNFIKSYMDLTEASKLYNEENDLNSSDSSQANCQNRKNVNNFFLKMDSNHISQKLVKVKSSPLIKPVRHLIKVGLIYEFCKSAG